MKKILFAMSAAAMVFAFGACQQIDSVEIDGDVGLAAQRPGVPTSVTLTTFASVPAQTNGPAAAILRWTVGANSESFEIFMRTPATATSPASEPVATDFGVVELGNARWITEAVTGTYTVPGGSANSFVPYAPVNLNLRHAYMTSLVAPSPEWIGTFQIGVRASALNTVSGQSAPSEIAWAYTPITLRAEQ